MIPGLIAVLAALLHLFAEDALGPSAPLVKAVPAAILGALVLRSRPRMEGRLAGFGLLFSAVADFVIEFSFLGGLGVFLLAHLFYIGAFTLISKRLCLGRLLPVAVWAALALPVLVGHAGPLALPVLIYGLVIFVMIWRAAAAARAIGWNPGTMGLTGAAVFGISDTLLGYSRFVPQGQAGALTPLLRSDFLIMGTYWAGQTLIALSFLRRR